MSATPGPKGLTEEQIIDALEKNGGLITQAAESLGITRQSLHYRLKTSPHLKTIRSAELENLKDVAESWIAKYIRQGDKRSIEFFMERHGNDRGWGRNVKFQGEVQHSLDPATFAALLAGMTDEQRAAFDQAATAISGGAAVHEEQPGSAVDSGSGHPTPDS